MIEGDLRIPKMYNFIFTIIFDVRPKVDEVILPSPLNIKVLKCFFYSYVKWFSREGLKFASIIVK